MQREIVQHAANFIDPGWDESDGETKPRAEGLFSIFRKKNADEDGKEKKKHKK